MMFDHDHGHDHHSSNEEQCCSSNDCCNSNSMTFDHSHSSNEEQCCSSNDCCSSGHIAKANVVVLDHSHTHDHITEIDSHHHVISVTNRNCTECDPTSTIPHAVQVSRIKVANLCCAGEERIIMKSLANVHGVNSVSVNIIGRYAIVRHCPAHECCASVDKIINILNNQRLGASIFEISDDDDSKPEDPFDILKGIQVLLIWACFAVGLSLEVNLDLFVPGVIVFSVGTAIGIFPIIHGAYLSVLRYTLDINILILIALIAAFVIGEYSDPPLLIALFLSADLLESTIMNWIRNNVKINPVGLPKKAVLKSGSTVPISELKMGDIITARAGEMIPVDGLVIYGNCSVDESSLTGEPVGVQKTLSSRVLGGTIVVNGYIEIKIDTDLKNSSINKLSQAICDVQAEKGIITIITLILR